MLVLKHSSRTLRPVGQEICVRTGGFAPCLEAVGRYALARLRIGGRVSPVERGASIDELLDRAVAAINRGDRAAATALAGQVLAVDRGNADAEDLLAAPGERR